MRSRGGLFHKGETGKCAHEPDYLIYYEDQSSQMWTGTFFYLKQLKAKNNFVFFETFCGMVLFLLIWVF